MIKTFVKRIWLTIVMSSILTMTGGLSFNSLEWNLEAKKKRPVITIVTSSKNPTTVLGMEKVTKTLEKDLKKLKGIKSMSSLIDSNKSTIELNLDDDASMVDLLKEVGNIIVTAKKPDYVKLPVVQQSSKSDLPLIVANIYSKNIPLLDVTKYAKEVIAGKMEKIKGVSYIEVKGDPKPEIQIKILQDRVSYYNININQIRRAFEVYNKEKGFIPRQTNMNEFAVVANSSLKNLEDIKNVIIDFQRMIKVSDIAEVSFAKKDFMNENWVNGNTRVLTLKVFKTNEGNPLESSDAVLKILKEWEEKHNLVLYIEDNAQDIRDFFAKTKKTFLEAIVIILLVVVVFLGSLKSSITPILAIPISLISTFSFMLITGCSINVSTIMAFLLSIGLVVDDAILVVENITTHYMKNHNLEKAAIDGTREIQVSIIVMTLTLACVFSPAIISKGSFGATLKEFAITLSISVIISGIVSLTLTPSISARVLGHSELAEKILYPIEYIYKILLKFALKIKSVFVIFTAFSMAGSYLIFKTLPKESVPTVESREVEIYSVNSGNKHLSFFKKQAEIIVKYLKAHKEVENFVIYMDNSIFLDIKLKKDSKAVVKDVSKEMLEYLDKNIKDVAFVTKSTKSSTSFDVYVYGNVTRTEIKDLGEEFARGLRYSSKIANAIQYSVTKTGYNLSIDYQKAAAIGCDIETLERVVEILNTRYFVSDFEKDGKKYKIVTVSDKSDDINKILQNVWNEQRDRKQIKISPSVFTQLVQAKQVTTLSNYNGLPAFKIEISGTQGVKIGDLVDTIQKIHKKTAGHKTELAFTGKAREFLEDQGEMQKMFVLAASFIFLILLAQFESLKSTILVMMTAPLAIFGALIFIKAKGSINIYSTIAIITLIGLITKHGILFVNTANEYHANGMNKYDSSYNAAVNRLRPVLMTTIAMVFGLLPLMFEKDPSMIKLVQMAEVLVPGLTFGTLMTLFVIPCLYLI